MNRRVFGPQTENVSQGLFPDGNTNGSHSMTNWTPRAPNTLAGPLSFTSISFDNGLVTLIWSAIPGRSYRIEFKDELSGGAWTQPGNELLAFDATLSIIDSPPAAA